VSDDADGQDSTVSEWFLAATERGNPATQIDAGRGNGLAHTAGNQVRPLVHGAAYFRRLHEELSRAGRGDWVLFTDWRGDPDERLLPSGGPDVEEALTAAAERGADVRGLMWRSHSDFFRFSGRENRMLGDDINRAGGEVLLDERVRMFGSHHQKLVVIIHGGRPADNVAFVGGIDLAHSRRDDERHEGDRQRQRMDRRYGPRPPWHDAMVEVRGPAVRDIAWTFVERWQDPTALDHRSPLRALIRLARRHPRHTSELAAPLDDQAPADGPHAVQVLRTYPHKHPPYPFAPTGERSIARGYIKALRRARRLIYVEDQYLWSDEVAEVFATALQNSPELHLIAVVPRYPDEDGLFSRPPNIVGRARALAIMQDAGPDRVHVYDLESEAGVPIYVHAKICVIDDVFAIIGSDNLNRRSWTHDSEMFCAVLDRTRDDRAPLDPGGLGDGARVFARDLRLSLWAEHLRCSAADPSLLDPIKGVAIWRERAVALDDWHTKGRAGPRPPGRVRKHLVDAVHPLARPWASLVYHAMFDPDGRPPDVRRAGAF
jgi:phosphatidylserine/phosphatidylglycerophosphate/cardiolipin synthase-like enzyme